MPSENHKPETVNCNEQRKEDVMTRKIMIELRGFQKLRVRDPLTQPSGVPVVEGFSSSFVKSGVYTGTMALLDTPVDEVGFSQRSYDCLKNANIRTLRDLVTKAEADLLRTKNFGRRSL